MVYALVVIYNKTIDDSLTLQCLQNYSDRIQIMVYDNSTKNLHNYELCAQRGYAYDSCGMNVGLSKAYNMTLKKINKSDKDYIIILDDDTKLNDNFINEVIEKTNAGTSDILLPIVKSGDLIISPCNMTFNCKPSMIKDISKIDKKRISAINSGMVVRLSIYDSFSYNEKLFLDYVDHDFMNRIRKCNLKIDILNCAIEQNFSMESLAPIKSAISRFEIQKKDLKVYYKEYNRFFIYFLYIIWIAFKQTVKYKSLFFLLHPFI